VVIGRATATAAVVLGRATATAAVVFGGLALPPAPESAAKLRRPVPSAVTTGVAIPLLGLDT
jgi:hypothetical protein